MNTSLFPLKSGFKKQARIKTPKIKLAIFRILERAPEIFLGTFRPFLSRAMQLGRKKMEEEEEEKDSRVQPLKKVGEG